MTTLVRWNPTPEFAAMNRVMAHAFRNFFNAPVWPAENGDRPLALDVSSTDEAYTVQASLPGFSPDNVDVSVDRNVLTIKAEVNSEKEDEKPTYVLRERYQGSYQRSLRLPEGINAGEVAASFDNGLLTVTVPKAEEVKPNRIPVHTAA